MSRIERIIKLLKVEIEKEKGIPGVVKTRLTARLDETIRNLPRKK